MVLQLRLRSPVGPKGQVVIPKPVRDLLGISPGDEVVFRVQGDDLILEKTSNLQILEEYLAVGPKTPEPKHIDWDKEYYRRFR